MDIKLFIHVYICIISNGRCQIYNLFQKWLKMLEYAPTKFFIIPENVVQYNILFFKYVIFIGKIFIFLCKYERNGKFNEYYEY